MKMMTKSTRKLSIDPVQERTNLAGEIDPFTWAEEFVKSINENPAILNDIETLSMWFSVAITSGYDYAKKEKMSGSE